MYVNCIKSKTRFYSFVCRWMLQTENSAYKLYHTLLKLKKNVLMISIYIWTIKHNYNNWVFLFPCFPFLFPLTTIHSFSSSQPRRKFILEINISSYFLANFESLFQSSNAFLFISLFFCISSLSVFTDWILSCSTEDHIQP